MFPLGCAHHVWLERRTRRELLCSWEPSADPCPCHRITESRNVRGWKGPLWVTQSNPSRAFVVLLGEGRPCDCPARPCLLTAAALPLVCAPDSFLLLFLFLCFLPDVSALQKAPCSWHSLGGGSAVSFQIKTGCLFFPDLIQIKFPICPPCLHDWEMVRWLPAWFLLSRWGGDPRASRLEASCDEQHGCIPCLGMPCCFKQVFKAAMPTLFHPSVSPRVMGLAGVLPRRSHGRFVSAFFSFLMLWSV